jgi:hypothetical protein
MEGYADLPSKSERLSALVSAWYVQAMDDEDLALMVGQLDESDLMGAERSIFRELQAVLKIEKHARTRKQRA